MSDDSNKKSGLEENIRSGDHSAFESMFFKYYQQLCAFSYNYVKSQDIARDIVQEVFINIWSNRKNFYINQSLKAYLYTAVRNQSLNYLQQRKRMEILEEKLKQQETYNELVDVDELSSEQIAQKVWELVEQLPERRRTIFILYRRHGLSYIEISEVMGITRKTVENQMGKSLKFLRENLKF